MSLSTLRLGYFASFPKQQLRAGCCDPVHCNRPHLYLCCHSHLLHHWLQGHRQIRHLYQRVSTVNITVMKNHDKLTKTRIVWLKRFNFMISVYFSGSFHVYLSTILTCLYLSWKGLGAVLIPLGRVFFSLSITLVQEIFGNISMIDIHCLGTTAPSNIGHYFTFPQAPLQD